MVTIRRIAVVGGYSLFAGGCGVLALFAVQEELPAAYTFTLVLNVLAPLNDSLERWPVSCIGILYSSVLFSPLTNHVKVQTLRPIRSF